MLLSDIRKVTLYWLEGPPTSYLVPTSQVDRFVAASKELHWKPGKNPHNGEDASKVWRVTVAPLEMRGPFWWTVPGLERNDDPAGAQIIDGGTEKAVFVDEEVVNRWNAEEAEAEARYYRERGRQARETELQN